VTLRARIAIALAVLAGLATIAVAATAYVATDARLNDEVDESIEQAVRRLDDTPLLTSFCGARGGGTSGGGGGGGGAGGGRAGRGPLEQLLPPDNSVQCIDVDGQVVESTSVLLPVDDGDRRLAAEGGARRTRTVEVDGDTYRVETVPLAAPNGTVVGAVQIAREYGETLRVLGALRRQLIVIGVLVTVAGAVVGWLIARRSTRPLAQLTDAAEEVAETGRLDVDLPAGGTDEPGRLSRSFGSMLGALRESRDQQQQLVQDAGHELRTPLTSLRTNVELLQRHHDLPPDTRAAILRDLDSESRELATLVDELVQLATDQWSDEPDQRLALDELVQRLAHRAERRTGRPVPVTVHGAPVWVVGRPRELARAIGNLIDNAAKFSPPGTPVEVWVQPGQVTVRDHGPGVAVEDRPHVFDRFYRSAAAKSLPGSGLGLAIVDQTARAHGGSVAVTEHPEGGAVFTLVLPAA
jgi:two-component system sensor histidine kinase MprB